MVANAKAKAIGKRFENLLPTEANLQTAPVPLYSNNYAQRVRIENNACLSDNLTAIIDVQPDFRNIILYINYYVTKEYPDYIVKGTPFMSPPAFTAYCLALVYGYALLNDDENVRTEQSAYVRDFSTTANLDTIKTMIRRLHVPTFMVPLLNGLAVSIDERKPDLKYVYSLASFDLEYDFGRAPPISLFFTAHNLIATQAANQPPATITQLWLNTELMTAPLALRVSNYLGIVQEAYHINWFAQSCYSLFNPVTIRTVTVRPTFSPIHLYSQELNVERSDVNPYIHLLLMDPDNHQTTEKALNNISRNILEFEPNPIMLGEIEFNSKGNQLISHYYQRYQIPTFNLSTNRIVIANQVRPRDYTIRQKLLVPVKSIPKVPLKMPPASDTFLSTLYLTNGIPYMAANDPDFYREFNTHVDLTDRVRHLAPFETMTQELFFNIIHGKLIESEELDSSSVPQPNPDHHISIENSYFLESAVPFSAIHIPTGENVNIINRINRPDADIQVRVDLYNRALNRLPLYGQQLRDYVPAALKGFDRVTDIPTSSRASNTISYLINSGTATTEVKHRIHAWSSYRYINTKQDVTVNIRNRKLMILNFRTLFGTNATLIETNHPSRIIPQS